MSEIKKSLLAFTITMVLILTAFRLTLPSIIQTTEEKRIIAISSKPVEIVVECFAITNENKITIIQRIYEKKKIE